MALVLVGESGKKPKKLGGLGIVNPILHAHEMFANFSPSLLKGQQERAIYGSTYNKLFTLMSRGGMEKCENKKQVASP